jgi:hypothetical protein
MPDETKPCKPLSVTVGLRRNDTQKIEFGLTKSCKKVEEREESVWVIHFALLEKDGDEFTAKVSVDIAINQEAPAKEKAAETTARNGVSENQTQFLLGPVARAADKVVEEPRADEIRALFAGMDVNALRDADADEDASLELLDRAAEERDKNMRRLRSRVISVLDAA